MNVSLKDRSPAWLVWFNLAIVYVVWGSTYFAIRVMIETLPAILSGGVRFVIAGLLMAGWVAWRKGWRSLLVPRREALAATLVGTLLFLGGNGLVALGELSISSSLAALIIASVPLWVVVFRALTGEKVAGLTLVGVAVGFTGVAILVLPGASAAGASIGYLLLIIASFSWATGSFLSQRLPLPKDAGVSVTLQMALGGIVVCLAGLLRGEGAQVQFDEFSGASLIAFGYLVFAGSILAFSAYSWLLQNAPISKVSTYAYVNPVIAVFLGAVFANEEVTGATLVGATVIVASVAFIVRKESASRETESPRDRSRRADLPEEGVPAALAGADA